MELKQSHNVYIKEPDTAEAWFNRGISCMENSDYAEAETCFRRTLSLAPGSLETVLSLGCALDKLGRSEEALNCYESVLAVAPDNAKARYNRAIHLLRNGNLAAGFADYEARFAAIKNADGRVYDQPRWDGSPLNGRSILVYCEQGLGDAIQFVRYIPCVTRMGGRVVLEVQQPLVSLLSTCSGAEIVVAKSGVPPVAECHIPLLSLPHIFGTTLDTVPSQVPYLSPDPSKVAIWRQMLAGDVQFKVGVVWRGSATNPMDREYSCPLADLAPLLAISGISYYSLQVRPAAGEITQDTPLKDMTEHLLDFSDTAALLVNLDLVITVDTAVAHLAGALGRPVWLLLTQTPDWRWMLERDDSPWYPGMRLFRQTRTGDWPSVVREVALALRQHLPQQKHEATVSAEMLETCFQQALVAIEYNDADNAILELRSLLVHMPDDPAVWFNLGRAYDLAGRFAESELAYRQALSDTPDSPAIWFALGEVRLKQKAYSGAEFCLRKAHGLKPDSVEILLSLGSALSAQCKSAEAFAACQKILAIRPDCVEAAYNMAFIQLRSGDYRSGFANFEARLAIEKFDIDLRKYKQPRWDGSPLNGRSVLIYGEQGMGDVIQFARYIPLVVERGGKVVFEVDPPLIPLFEDFPGVDWIVPKSKEPPLTDVYIQSLSLPYLFGTTLDTVPNQVPYILPNQAKVEQWRQCLGSHGPAYRIGLVWRGNPRNPFDQVRSCPLEEFLPLAAFHGVQFFSLQVGAGTDEIADLDACIKLIDHTDQLRDFSDTAAFIANLDLVIGADTAVTHLAGSLGKKVWILLPHAYDWRWLPGRDDSPWYPTAHLFWQHRQADWAGVMTRVKIALIECLAGKINNFGPADIEIIYNHGTSLKEAGEVSLIEDAGYHNQQGIELLKAGFAAEAEQAFYRSVELNPDSAETRCNRGVALDAVGRYDEALASYREALLINPDFVQALYNMGNTYLSLNNQAAARECYLRTVELKPDFVAAYLCLGEIGKHQRVFDQAQASYESALSIDPDCATAWQGVAEIRQAQEDFEQAIVAYKKALSLDSGITSAWNMLGTVFHNLEQLEEAEVCYRQALALQPDLATILNNLGVVLNSQGRLGDAIAIYRHLLEVDDAYAEGHWNLSVALLAAGEYLEGWREYEWRFRKANPVASRDFPQPLWDGSALHGRNLLLHAEQGFGDTIQFARYARLVAQRGGRVILECQVPALKRLLHSLEGVAEIVVAGEPLSPFDCHLPMMSLPLVFGTTLETIPAQIPYLVAEPADVEAWGQRLGPAAAFRVGLVWFAKQSQVLNRKRSCRLEMFAPLWAVPGVEFFSLQIGLGAEQLAECGAASLIKDLTGHITDFADTAGFIANLDLVITIDTAVAHLAGALGARTWVILPHIAEWRWLCLRQDSPWYPTMRLFRQPMAGDWSGLMSSVAEALNDCVQAEQDMTTGSLSAVS